MFGSLDVWHLHLFTIINTVFRIVGYYAYRAYNELDNEIAKYDFSYRNDKTVVFMRDFIGGIVLYATGIGVVLVIELSTLFLVAAIS